MIRWKRSGDNKTIIDLVRKELVPFSRFPGIRIRHLRRDIAARLKRGHTLVAAEPGLGRPFGFLRLEIHGPVLFIDLLAVDSARQNRQWGTRLMRAAEAYGISAGCAEARLFVDDTNTRGLKFYAKLGYVIVRHVPEASCYELAKPLRQDIYCPFNPFAAAPPMSGWSAK